MSDPRADLRVSGVGESDRRVFRSLASYNFRVWSAGALLSNVGTWMQRIAQDWLVLTELTRHDAAAVGLVTALQFAPQLLLLPWTGYAADHVDRRKLLVATQGAMGALALGLGLLTRAGVVRVWHVYGFAFLLGCAAAFDAPARQTFVADMVGEADLPNAVALNSASFNASRLVGPAVAGLLIGAVGTGWVFLLNAASFVAVLGSLGLMRAGELHAVHAPSAPPARDRAGTRRGGLADAVRYVRERPDLTALCVMLCLFGTFGLNFPVFISSMAVSVFHAGAGGFGLLTSAMAVGSVTGALLAARRERPSVPLIAAGAGVFGVGYALAAVMPSYHLFGLALVLVGAASQTVTTSTTSLVQLSTEPAMRGRVMALLLTVALGGQPVGAPLVGWIANTFGPRWALGVGAAAGFATAAVGLAYLARSGGLRLRAGRPHLGVDRPGGTRPATPRGRS
ncbi:MFS transporter [Gemmatimonadetes bacterium T265]|nr:MFS transporter [Gemmatimonadetes bacterium T265]